MCSRDKNEIDKRRIIDASEKSISIKAEIARKETLRRIQGISKRKTVNKNIYPS